MESPFHHFFDFRRHIALELFPEQLLHLFIQLCGLFHIPLFTVGLEQQGVDGFIIRIVGDQHPAVPGHLGQVLHSHCFLQFLQQRIHVQAFQTVPFREVPIFVLCRILDEKALKKGSLIQFQIPSRIRFELLHIHLDTDGRVDLDDGFARRNENIRSQDLLGFINGIAQIFPGNGIRFVRPQHAAQLIPHHRPFDQDVIDQSIDLVVREEDFPAVLLDYRSAQKPRLDQTCHFSHLIIEILC